MAVREVLTYPDPVLKQLCAPAQPEDVARVATDLLDTMRSFDHCVGLAAPQIGEPVRIAVVDVSAHPRAKDPHGLMVLVNPRVTARSEGSKVSREGCLSLPDLTANVRRPRKATVEFTGYLAPVTPGGGRTAGSIESDAATTEPGANRPDAADSDPAGADATGSGGAAATTGSDEAAAEATGPVPADPDPADPAGHAVHRVDLASFEARCVLHEIDHLDGILFLDRVASITDDLFRRRTYR